jgi:L-alanine-DL-glutamate epimerase-like enolase superfamily enzyme
MHLELHPFTVRKRVPLTISRGTTTETTNLFVRIEHDGIEGWGEASPFSIGATPQTSEAITRSLQALAPQIRTYSPLERQRLDLQLQAVAIPSAARSALDLALHDWLGQRAGLPLWQLWGLDLDQIVPTSVTIGISTPEAAQARVHRWLGQSAQIQALKVKLGSPEGIAADQAMLLAVKQAAPHIDQISVDANGGWGLADAMYMADWLADQGITYLEQPLPRGQEEDLLGLYQRTPLPIFVDESCCTTQDLPYLVDRVHGINIKLNKAGGLAEVLRLIHTARAFGLQVMLGCYSDSTLMNTALAQVSPLADYLDLDSHLNLLDDPFVGATFENGRVMPNHRPGLGVAYAAAQVPPKSSGLRPKMS